MSAQKKVKPPTKTERRLAAAVLAYHLAPEDVKALGMEGAEDLLGSVSAFLRDSAEAMREAARKKAATRVPLIAQRYAKTLAESIHGQLASRGEGAAWTWLSVAMPSLHAAYMQGAAATMSTHDAHPGSRAGVIIVDARKLEDFADDTGKTTAASVLARVRGEPKPKGGA